MIIRYIAPLFALLLISTASAHQWVYDSGSITMQVSQSSEFEMIRADSGSSVQEALVNLSFYPRDSQNQKILSQITIPQAQVSGDVLIFRWDDPVRDQLRFSVSSKVRAQTAGTNIRIKVPFPISAVPKELETFTEPSSKIDSGNPMIIRQASEIASGESDMFFVASKIAAWTRKEVKYDLSTLTAEVSQKASWVLENRQGVCDEITNLYIAMLRSLGIPARFVSGVAYSGEQGIKGWGPHGWAEVYFPGTGWVPYDVTYGEYGYVDASHVKMKESLDPDESSTGYRWKGTGVEIDTNPVDTEVELVEYQGAADHGINLEINTFATDISFGSYDLVEVEVSNEKQEYQATEVRLSAPLEVQIHNPDPQLVILPPMGKASASFIISVDDSLDDRFQYTFPLIASTTRNISAHSSFASSKKGLDVSKEEIQALAKSRADELKKAYSKRVSLDCSIDKPEFYPEEDVKIMCRLKNSGNVMLEGIDICHHQECRQAALGISQEEQVEFSPKKDHGNTQSIITVESDDISKSVTVDYKVLDRPKISLEGIDCPSEVAYDGQFSVSVMLKKESGAVPKSVSVLIETEQMPRSYDLGSLPNDRHFSISFRGSDLKAGENNLKMTVSYEDEEKNSYTQSAGCSVALIDVNFIQHVMIFLQTVGNLMVSLFV